MRDFIRALGDLEREIGRELQNQNGCCGISVAQRQLLLELRERPKASLTELAEALALDKSTLSRSLESLRKVGWAQSLRDPEDRRNLSAALTEEGRRKAAEIEALCESRYGGLLGALGEAERRHVLEGSRLLADLLEAERLGRGEKLCCGPFPSEGEVK